jgi:1-phosphatidylinositol-4-phosphate 5-kinase
MPGSINRHSDLDAGEAEAALAPTYDTLHFEDGSLYTGTVRGGLPDGLGSCTWPDGNAYDGEWRAGCMHGFGTFTWATGERYDGEWKVGVVAHRHSCILWPMHSTADLIMNLARCISDQQAMPSMQMAMCLPRPANETGLFFLANCMLATQDGKRNGIGLKCYADGSTFEGFWREGNKHGVGVFRPVRVR